MIFLMKLLIIVNSSYAFFLPKFKACQWFIVFFYPIFLEVKLYNVFYYFDRRFMKISLKIQDRICRAS